MLGGRGVVLVFHLEHDRDDLVAVLVALAEDEVALGALGRVVVLLKVRIGKRRHAQAVELGLAMLLQGLAHHLGREARLHIAQALDLLVLKADYLCVGLAGLFQLKLMGGLHLLALGIAHGLLAGKGCPCVIALALDGGDGLHAGDLRRAFLRLRLGFKVRHFLFGRGYLLLHGLLRLGAGRLHGKVALACRRIQLRLELGCLGGRLLQLFLQRAALLLHLGA